MLLLSGFQISEFTNSCTKIVCRYSATTIVLDIELCFQYSHSCEELHIRKLSKSNKSKKVDTWLLNVTQLGSIKVLKQNRAVMNFIETKVSLLSLLYCIYNNQFPQFWYCIRLIKLEITFWCLCCCFKLSWATTSDLSSAKWLNEGLYTRKRNLSVYSIWVKAVCLLTLVTLLRLPTMIKLLELSTLTSFNLGYLINNADPKLFPGA